MAKHDHHEGGMQCCAHHEIEIERHIVLYLVGGLLVATSTLTRLLHWGEIEVTALPALVGSLMLAFPLFGAALGELRQLRASSSSLAALAILAAMATGQYETAGWLAFILLFADQFVRRTAWGAQRAIEDLMELTPDIARIIEADGTEREVGLAEVKVGMTVRIRPGENFPVDGEIATGRSSIDQASLTGESVPIEAQAGDSAYAGTTNLTGNLDITVTQVGEETTIGKVQQLIYEAEQTRSPRQLLIEQVAAFFVPVALSIAAIMWFIKSQSDIPMVKDSAMETAVTVLVVTCPAALLLSSPSAMVAAFAAAARLGVLIKETSYLEAASSIDTVVFDKTGTITTGKFEVSRLAPAEGVDGADLLAAAANGEQHSNHPLALSILKTARAAKIEPDGSTEYEEIHGRGVRAKTSLGELCIGRATWLMELNPAITSQVQTVEAKIEGMSGVHVMRDGKYLGAVGLEDKVQPNTRVVIDDLRHMGVRHVAMFTGDRLSVAKRVGAAVGVDTIEAECLPEEKHEQIQGMVDSGYKTLMVGDGINDGPSLAAADVGVAMGLAGSDIATNSAGIALMTDDLGRIPFLIELSRKTRAIVAQNIALSIVVATVGITLAATGNLAIWVAAMFHFAGDILVLANSFRLFRFGEDYAEAEHIEKPVLRRREASVRGMAATTQTA